MNFVKFSKLSLFLFLLNTFMLSGLFAEKKCDCEFSDDELAELFGEEVVEAATKGIESGDILQPSISDEIKNLWHIHEQEITDGQTRALTVFEKTKVTYMVCADLVQFASIIGSMAFGHAYETIKDKYHEFLKK